MVRFLSLGYEKSYPLSYEFIVVIRDITPLQFKQLHWLQYDKYRGSNGPWDYFPGNAEWGTLKSVLFLAAYVDSSRLLIAAILRLQRLSQNRTAAI